VAAEITHVHKCLQDWVLGELNAAPAGTWQYGSACPPEGISQTWYKARLPRAAAGSLLFLCP